MMEVVVVAAFIALGLMALGRLLPNSALGRWRSQRWFAWVVAGVLLVKLTEDVLGQETAAGDEAVLRWIHETAPATWHGAAILVTDTAAFLSVCITALVVGALLVWRRRRREAVALVLTPAIAGAVIYLFKGGINRTRPALWDTDLYWGSSFPSGHTLAAAALATALGLLASRLESQPARVAVRASLALWVAAVAFSRMYLGVHWPTDVAAAACAGALVAIGVHAALLHLGATRRSRQIPSPP